MYRVIKALNNNGILALDQENGREVIFLGNGVGFGKRTGQRVESFPQAKRYELAEGKQKTPALAIVNCIEPVYLEITAEIIDGAEKRFPNMRRDILLPLADHIALAVKRTRDGEMLPNPFVQDMRALFPEEFAAARDGCRVIERVLGVRLSEDEAGYISLHIHAGLSGENVSESMDTARLVKESISMIEEGLQTRLPADSLGYNRLMSHIRYMIERIRKGENVNLDMEDYARTNFPESYALAKEICRRMERELKRPVPRQEVGFLGIHIQRVAMDRGKTADNRKTEKTTTQN